MSRPTAQAASLNFLLANTRAHQLCGVDSNFGGRLSDYGESILADLQTLPTDAAFFDEERLGLLVQSFNVGSLLDVLLGRYDLAETLVYECIRTIETIAALHRERRWLALRVQPVINLARLQRVAGDARACRAIMDDLVQWAHELSLNEIDAHADRVLENCHRAETLKAEQMLSGLPGVRRLLSLRGHISAQSLDPLEFEILLKASLRARDHDGLLHALEERSPCEEWAPIYAVDALLDNAAWALACNALEEIIGRATIAPDRILGALAIRAASCEMDTTAADLCQRGYRLAADRGDEQATLRFLTLMAVLGDRCALENVHELILASRHNAERLISCTALHIASQGDGRYGRYARTLRAAMCRNISVVSAVDAIMMQPDATNCDIDPISCSCKVAARTHAKLLQMSTRLVTPRSASAS